MPLLVSPFALLALLALARWLAPLPEPTRPTAWSRLDIGLAIGVGALYAGGSVLWLSTFYLKGELLASDFSQYCDSVGAVQLGEYSGGSGQRSFFAALLPGVLARAYGIMGGLQITALGSTAAIAAGLYVWARALAGREAGVAAVGLACAMAPLVLLSRTVTFYPEATAAMLLVSAGAALALTERSLGALWICSTSAGIALLMDPRGLYWAAAALLAGAMVVFLRPGSPSRWWRAAGIAALLLPIVLSWEIASAFTPPLAAGLTRQTAAMVSAVTGQSIAVAGNEDFIWGRTFILNVPRQVVKLASLNAALRDALPRSPEHDWVIPWFGPFLACGLAASIGRDRWALAALWIPALPSIAALATAERAFGYIRYVGTGFPVIAVVLAVGARACVTRTGGRVPVALRAPLLGLTLLALITGLLPSWLSPRAPWRAAPISDEYPAALLATPPRAGPSDRQCVVRLQADREGSRTY